MIHQHSLDAGKQTNTQRVRERKKVGVSFEHTSSDKAAVVLHALVSAARRFLLLILLGYLGRLATHFPCAGQRSMYLACIITITVTIIIIAHSKPLRVSIHSQTPVNLCLLT